MRIARFPYIQNRLGGSGLRPMLSPQQHARVVWEVLADVGQKHIDNHAKYARARAWPKYNLYAPVQWNPYKLGM